VAAEDVEYTNMTLPALSDQLEEGLLPTRELRRKCFGNALDTASEKTCRLVEAAIAGYSIAYLTQLEQNLRGST
jgi:hypothetical protein